MQFAFESEIIHTQCCIQGKRLDTYFPKYKLGIEVDEYDHKGRNPRYKQSRQLMIESPGIAVIRTNPEASNCLNKLTNQLYMHITKSTEKHTLIELKKSLIDGLSKRLLELESELDHSIKSKNELNESENGLLKKILPTI